MVVAPGSGAVHVGAQLGVDALHRRVIEDPAGELDGVTAHVHEDAAAGEVHIPEPVGVGPVVAFELPHVVDAAQGALVHELFGAHVLGCEAQLLRVHELDARPAAGLDHLVAFLEVQREGLLADHVLSGLGGVDCYLTVDVVGTGDGDQVDVVSLE